MVGFGWVLWHINPCLLFNAISCLYIYIKSIWFGLVGFYGISTNAAYLMPNPVYTYILNIYDLVWFDLVWFDLVLWHINQILLITFLNEPKLILLHTVKWIQVSLFTINHTSFICNQFKCQTVLFDQKIGPYQVLQLRVRVGLGAIAIKEYSGFFKAKFSLYIHIKYVWFGLVGFCGISTIVGYLMPNLVFTFILNI